MYNKIFTKILDSSIWLEPMATRIVWITLLAAMDSEGYAHFSALENLAARARVSSEECAIAIQALTSPDPDSADPANDGRRVERVPGGFIILNAKKYREIVNKFSERESLSSIHRKHREQSAGEVDKGREGYVYFLQKVGGGNIKIGFSSNPWARLHELKTACDEDLVILKAIKAFYSDELAWHQKYKEFIVKGEWYLPTDELLADISALSGDPALNGVRSVATLKRSQLRHASASASESESEGESEGKAGKSVAEELVRAWNSIDGVVGCRAMTKARLKALSVRLKDPQWADEWPKAIVRLGRSNFCKGGGSQGWRASMDWFLTPEALTRILEGQYDNEKANKPSQDFELPTYVAPGRKI